MLVGIYHKNKFMDDHEIDYGFDDDMPEKAICYKCGQVLNERDLKFIELRYTL